MDFDFVISNLKIDKVTVWDGGAGADGKTGTAGFLSGLAGSVPPLHEIARNVGVELPAYLGKLDEEKSKPAPSPKSDEGSAPQAPSVDAQ